jgi:circadian clock protein KaiC
MAVEPTQAVSRVRTGIVGLDDILGGGLPPDRVYLIQGDPGTGKTTTSIQFLLEGHRRGENTLFITLSETREELSAVAGSHGWSLDGIHIFELSAAQQSAPGEQNTLFMPSEVELNELTQLLLEKIDKIKPTRVVIDSLSELRLLSQSPLRFRRQVLALKQHFIGRKVTVLLLDDRLGATEEAQAHTVAHGMIEFEQLAPDYGAARRRLRVVKLRGVKFRGGWHDYTIVTGGLHVFPRLIAAEHRPGFDPNPVPSGVAELDTLLGGGVERGTSMMIMGPAGAGKTTIAMQFAAAAARRGDHAAFFLFDENIHTMLARARGIGMDFESMVDQEKVSIRQIDPAELAPGEFVSNVRDLIEKRGTRVVIIDSINGYMNAMPAERFLTVHMHELLTYLSQRGVLTILIMAQYGLMGRMDSPFDLSYLSDTVLLLRYFEAQGTVNQAISVMKKRTGRHERTIRQYSITPQGVRIGPPLVEFHGVLTGVPTYTGNRSPWIKEGPRAVS